MIGALYTRNRQRFPPAVQYGDVVRGLPVASDTCAGVYASHVLEHLALDDFQKAVDETMRILRPGGVFRLVVPDMEQLARDYIRAAETGEIEAAHRFIRSAHLGAETRSNGLGGFVREWLGNSRPLGMGDCGSLRAALDEHGFVSVRRADFGDCNDPAFAAVEDQGRFLGACAVEARKPAEAARPAVKAAA